MSFIDRCINVVAPYDCLNCGREGALLCQTCLPRLAVVPERCYRCRRASSGSLTCAACRAVSRLVRVRVGTIYESTAKALIWQLKFAGAQAAVICMADRLQPFINRQPGALIIPVPTATGRIRQRGYGQARYP